MMYKGIALPALPYYIYASWYQRADTCGTSAATTSGAFDYSGDEPYDVSQRLVHLLRAAAPDNNTDAMRDEPIESAHSAADRTVTSMVGEGDEDRDGSGRKSEIAIKVSNQSMATSTWEQPSGDELCRHHGQLRRHAPDHLVGGPHACRVTPATGVISLTSTWTALSRVVLADKPVLSQATIVENQIPSAWSDSSITAQVNLGKFTQGQAAYLFVVDASGAVSATGLALTAGGSTLMPNPPSQFTVQ
jgi:hypothetical protein